MSPSRISHIQGVWGMHPPTYPTHPSQYPRKICPGLVGRAGCLCYNQPNVADRNLALENVAGYFGSSGMPTTTPVDPIADKSQGGTP